MVRQGFAPPGSASFDFLEAFTLVFCPIRALRYMPFWLARRGQLDLVPLMAERGFF